MTAHATLSRSFSPAPHWLRLGQQALKHGQRDEAMRALRHAVAADPYHAESLLWLSGLCNDPRESLRLLARVLALDPRNEAAHEGIRWARRRLQGDDLLLPIPRTSAPLRAVYSMPAPSLAITPHRTNGDWLMRWARRTIVVCVALVLILSGAIVWLVQLPAPTASDTLVAAASAESAEVQPLDLPEVQLPTRAHVVDRAQVYAARADALMRQVDVTWTQQDWQQSALLLAQAIAFRPDDAILKRKLMAAYFNQAVNLIDEGQLERALTLFDQALEIAPNDPQVLGERDVLANYIKGMNLYNQRSWSSSAQVLRKVYASDAGYLETRGMLYRAYYQIGLDFKQQQEWQSALNAFQTAVAIDSDGKEARAELAKIQTTIQSLQPGAVGEKWIDINLTTQRFRAMQGQSVAYSFVTSTGENGRETNPGKYQVLDKIPNAYSRFWNLWMPYWMGIYWAGSSENGIHALPILSNGQTLWGGYLGRRVSFGCVILDTSAARLMYDWADIGTTVVIHY